MTENSTLPSGETALSLAEAVEAITPQPEETQQPAEAETQTNEPELQPEEQLEEEVTESEDVEETPEEATPEQNNGTVFTLDTGEELTAEEINRGFMRQSDYTKKTQELASTRKQLAAENQAVLSQISQVMQAVANPETEPDWEAIMLDDPDWQKTKIQWEKKQKQNQQNVELMKQTYADTLQKAKANAVQTLTSGAIQSTPEEWKDPQVMYNDVDSAYKSMMNIGYTAEEINNIADPRAILVMHLANKQMQQKGKIHIAKKAVKNKPQVLRPGSKQPIRNQAHKKVEQAKKAFEKNPTLANGVAYDMAVKEANSQKTT